MPASDVVASLAQTAAERGPFTFTGFAAPPTATEAIALIQAQRHDGPCAAPSVEKQQRRWRCSLPCI